MPFDPNGAFFKNGRYHLMYLYKRFGGERMVGPGDMFLVMIL